MRLNENLLERLCDNLEGVTDCLHAIHDKEHNVIEVTFLEPEHDSRTPESLILWGVDHAARIEVLLISAGRCTYGLYPTRKGGFKK